jgi:hypothetical protein
MTEAILPEHGEAEAITPYKMHVRRWMYAWKWSQLIVVGIFTVLGIDQEEA